MIDEEMICYYSGLAKRYGTLHACYCDAYAAADETGSIAEFSYDDPADPEFFDAYGFLLCAEPHPHREPGWPIDSLSKDPYFQRYYYDIADSEYRIPALAPRRAYRQRRNERFLTYIKIFSGYARDKRVQTEENTGYRVFLSDFSNIINMGVYRFRRGQ